MWRSFTLLSETAVGQIAAVAGLACNCFPSLNRKVGCALLRKYPDGSSYWAQTGKSFAPDLPVRAVNKEAARHLLDRAATPPVPGGEASSSVITGPSRYRSFTQFYSPVSTIL